VNPHFFHSSKSIDRLLFRPSLFDTMRLPSFVFSALLATAVVAHPGHDIQEELQKRGEFLASHTNNLDHCASVHRAAGLDKRAAERRAARVDELLQRRGLPKRQNSPVDKSHKSNKPYTPKTSPSEIFGGNKSCVLSPETTEGPFYVTGEAIRSNIVDGERGVPLHLDIQMVDVTTCQPVKGVYIEIWGANATGVYSGAIAAVNGNVNDKANFNRAFLRGIQQTDADGVVQFDTNFPGHYAGRASHVHIITHVEDAKAKENNTLWNLRVRHAGQAFFDQDLINAVEATAPYSTNRQARTANARDAILIQETGNGADPFFEYVQLGSKISDGVFGWISFGVNMTYSRTIMAVAEKFKEGGKMVTTNPKLPGFDAIFPGGFPTAFQPGFGAAAVETALPNVVKNEDEGTLVPEANPDILTESE